MAKCKLFCKILIVLITYSASSAVASNKDLGDYVNSLVTQFLEITKNSSLSEQGKVEKVQVLLNENLDFDWMGKFVLGRYRRNMSESQVSDFVAIYKSYLLKTYGDVVREYKGEKVTVKSVQPLSDNEFVVKVAVAKTDQDPILVDYMVRSGNSPYKVFDIATEGVSLISSQQAEFGSIIGSSGIATLQKDLIKKTKQ